MRRVRSVNNLGVSLVRACAAFGFLLLALGACADPGRFESQVAQGPLPTTEVQPTLAETAAETPPAGEQPVATTAPRDWTILYYASGDHESPSFIWEDLNEIEAAGLSDRVQVVATVDWPGSPYPGPQAVRYVMGADDNPDALTAQQVATLGEANFGDPAVLANFLAWGISTYPANHYALFLPGYGGGRAGCCLDQNVGLPDQSDHLSLTDISQAITLAEAQTGIDHVDVLATSASFMGQLDALAALQPAADYIVASPALVPGEGWEYRAAIGQLIANPAMDGAQMASMLVSEFGAYQRQLLGHEFTTMAAFDSDRIPELVSAVETLAAALQAAPEQAFPPAGDARRGAQPYGAAVASAMPEIALVDLRHAAGILAARAPSDLQGAAQAVVNAVDNTVVTSDRGQGLPNGYGLGIYWPSSAAALDPTYAQISGLPNWAAFLSSFTNATLSGATPYTSTSGDAGQTVAAGQPAVLTAEVIGRQLLEMAAVASEPAGETRRLLHQYETLPPPVVAMPGGISAPIWEDGRHESLLVWDSVTGYLYDSAGTAENTLLQTVDRSANQGLLTAQGDLRRAGSDRAIRSTLEFPLNNAVPAHIWSAFPVIGGQVVGQVKPNPGDTFQPYRFFSEADGRVTTEPGALLTFDNAPAIYRSARPLPPGTYQLGVTAATLDGLRGASGQDVVVGSGSAAPGFRSFVAPEFGVQFAFPDGWSAPVVENGVLFTSNISNTETLQVRQFPDWTSDLPALQDSVLETFGDISVLFQEDSRVGGLENPDGVDALRTVYGYTSADRGARVGSFLTFLKDGTGYLVDLDGPEETQADTLETLSGIADSWRFLGFAPGQSPNAWTAAALAGYQITYPTVLAYQEHNGWHRFTGDPQTFAAVRIQPAGRTPEEAVAALLQTASQNVSGFTPTEIRPFYYAGKQWTRSDFEYTGTGTPVRGLILVRQDNGQEIALWAEAPDGRQPDPFATVFLPMAGGITATP